MNGYIAHVSNTQSADRVLAARVARRYYLEDASKVQIAKEFGLSRFKVARLLTLARDEGIVTIEVNDGGIVDVARSEALREALNLTEAIVVTSHGTPTERRHQVGAAAADLLRDTLNEGDVLGLTWGRTLTAMTERLSSLPRVSVVQLTGAVGTNLNESPVEVVRRVALSAGADARAIFAPMLVEDAVTAAALRRQPDVASAIALFKKVTVAVVAIGSWDPPISQLQEVVPEANRKELAERGVIAEIAGILMDTDGRHVGGEFLDRCISVSPLELAQVPRVIAVAAGPSKARAVSAVAASGLVSCMVVDEALADAILGSQSG